MLRDEKPNIFEETRIRINLYDIIISFLIMIILVGGIFASVAWEEKNYWEEQYFEDVLKKHEVNIQQV